MPRRDLTRITVALAAAAFASVAIAGPAAAATTEKPEEACWLNADTGALACYESDAALDTALAERGIALVESAASTGRAASVEARGIDVAVAAATYYYYARLYADSGYSGAVYYVGGSSSTPCRGTTHSYVLEGAWNNRVSSYRGYLSCRVRLYDNANHTGASHGPAEAASSLGSFNDKASSFRLVD